MTCPLFISTVRPKSKIFVLFPSLVTELLPLNRNTLNCTPPVRPHYLSHITEAFSVEDDGGERMLAHEPGLARFSQQPLPANLLFQSNPKLDNVDLCVEEILVQQLHSSTLNAQS